MTFSNDYDSMFQNWLYWFQKLDLDMKLVVVAEDDEVYDKYTKESSFLLKSFNFPKIQSNLTTFIYDTPEFNQLTSRRCKLCKSLKFM